MPHSTNRGRREVPLTSTRELWHATGRAAREDRKRLVALGGVLWSGPLLLLGSLVSHALSHGPGAAFDGLDRPLAYIVAPLRGAYEGGHDVALLGYVAWQALLLCLLWAYFGGVIHRLAAVDLVRRCKEDGKAAAAFARRNWRSFAGARLALWLGVGLPLAAAVLLAFGGRLEGWLGGILLAVALLVALVFAVLSALIGSCWLMGGFVTGPAVACEDADAFEAVSRTFRYVGAALPRLLGLRLLFLGGVLLGSAWRFVRIVGAGLLAFACVRLGAGADGLDRALAVLDPPAGVERMDLIWTDAVVAGVMVLVLGALLAFWAADLVSRVICARTGVYLVMRREVEGVPMDALHTPPQPRDTAAADRDGVRRPAEE